MELTEGGGIGVFTGVPQVPFDPIGPNKTVPTPSTPDDYVSLLSVLVSVFS